MFPENALQRHELPLDDPDFLRRYYPLNTALRQEEWPEEPAPSFEQVRRQLAHIPDYLHHVIWAVHAPNDPDTLIAMAHLAHTPGLTTNRHAAQCYIGVLPPFRRQGIGRFLFRLIRREAQALGKRILTADATDAAPSGQAFLEHLGGEPAYHALINRLVLAQVDWDMLTSWENEGRRRNPDCRLVFLDSPYPEALLPAIAQARNLMNTAPRGDLEREDMEWTPELVRSSQETLIRRGYRQHMAAIFLPNDTIAGYTEILHNPDRPAGLEQEDTAVDPRYRGRGMGKWLKAAMLRRMVQQYPEVRFVYTGNADSNAPMLHINQVMGFRPYQRITVYQFHLQEETP